MKKIITFSFIAVFYMLLSGCGNKATLSQIDYLEYRSDYMTNPEGLDLEIVSNMRKDFQTYVIDWLGEQYKDEFILDSIWIQQYFGNFNDCEVVYMGSNLQHTSEERPVEIAGYVIVFPSGQEVYTYIDSMFYTIKEAYDADIISKEDVYDIGVLVGINFTEQYTDINKLTDKVEMIIESVTSKGLTFFIENTTENEYTYGEDYLLYVNNNNSWEPVQPIIENWGVDLIGYILFPNSKTDVTSIDWTWLYGELSNGEYRFQKTILYVRSPGDFDKYVLEQDFFVQSSPAKAPSLYVSLITDNSPIQSIQAIQLTTSWSFIDENGNGSGYEADSPHPLQLQPDDFNDATLLLENENVEIQLQFSDNYPPQFLLVQRWYAEYAAGEQDIEDVLDKSGRSIWINRQY